MGKLYQCDWERTDSCLGVSDDRTLFMGQRATNDQQTETLCCIHCLPVQIPVPNHMKKAREEGNQ